MKKFVLCCILFTSLLLILGLYLAGHVWKRENHAARSDSPEQIIDNRTPEMLLPKAYFRDASGTVLFINSINIEEGALISAAPSSDGEPLGRLPNGEQCSLISLIDDWAYVRASINGKKQDVYAMTSDLTPLDGSYGLYPAGGGAYLENNAYHFGNMLPPALSQTFTGTELEDYHPMLGMIIADGSKNAFVILSKDGHNVLCVLERIEERWVIKEIGRQLLYQGDLLPEYFYYSKYNDQVVYYYPIDGNNLQESFGLQCDADGQYYLSHYYYGPGDITLSTNKENNYAADVQGDLLIISDNTGKMLSTYGIKTTVSIDKNDFKVSNLDLQCTLNLIFQYRERPF